MALPGRLYRLAAVFMAIATFAGCASHDTVVSREEHCGVVGAGDRQLLIEAQTLEDGSVSLRAFRVGHRMTETSLPAVALRRGPSPDAVAIASSDVGWLALLDPRLVVAVIFGTYYVLAWVAEMLQEATAQLVRVMKEIGPQSSPEIISVRQTELAHEASPAVILVPSDGAGALLLGPQPAEGYRLDPALVQRLGGPGATVTAVDAEDDTLQSKFLIGSPR